MNFNLSLNCGKTSGNIFVNLLDEEIVVLFFYLSTSISVSFLI